MLESGVTSKGQTTLPRAVRRALELESGDRVRYVIHDGEVRMRRVRPVSRLFGVLQHDGPAVSLDDMEQAIADGARGA